MIRTGYFLEDTDGANCEQTSQSCSRCVHGNCSFNQCITSAVRLPVTIFTTVIIYCINCIIIISNSLENIARRSDWLGQPFVRLVSSAKDLPNW
jgi:hypothetical protein